MKVQHIRNATMLIESQKHHILVDPMLGKMGSMPTFTLFRFKAKKNPICPLPSGIEQQLEKVTHCLITHRHPDHIDQAAEQFLKARNIPVTCSVKDAQKLRQKGLNVVQTINYWKQQDFLGGKIEGIPARHGYGFIAKPMGNVMGFFLQLPNEPSLYLSSDTIYTKAVDKVLTTYQPDWSVLAGGSAQLDVFQPLLMHLPDILMFIKKSPKKVMVNHLEAVNHCPTTRQELRALLEKEGLLDKVWIPEDGATEVLV